MSVPDSEMEALHRRATKAWEVAALHHGSLREAYRWYMPRRDQEMQASSKEGNATPSAYNHLYDQTGMQSLDDGASQIAEAMFPWDQVWARWTPRPDVDAGFLDDLERDAEEMTNVCSALITSSNFDGSVQMALKEFLIGTSFLAGDVDPNDPARIRWTAVPAWQWAIEADAAGRVQAMFRKMEIRARDLEATLPYPDAVWSPDAMGKAKDQPDAMVCVLMAVYWAPPDRVWHCCYYEEQTKHRVYQNLPSRTPPVIVTRASPSAGMAWGDGPALRALPAVKVANRVVELILKNAAIAVTGMWQADDDGVLNPANVRLVPGTIIPKAVGSAGLTPLQSPGQFDVSQLVLEDLRVNIRRSFYVTRIEEREMSATEYSGRVQQQLREQRGIYGQLKEFVEQIMLRTLDLAERMGKLKKPGLDRVAQVELTGPLAADIRGLAVERFKQVVRDIQETAGPEMAVSTVEWTEALPWLAQNRHAESKLFKDKSGVQAIQQQLQDTMINLMAQAAAEGQMQDGAPS